MPTLALRRFADGLRARYHVWLGRRAYRSGRIRTAGRHLHEALACGHQSFSAWLLMGKVAYRERDLPRAAECFHRARSADPVRFSLEGYPDDFIASLRAHPEAPPHHDFRVLIEVRTRKPKPVRTRVSNASRRPPGNLGDFSSPAEWAAAQDRPAIRPGEGADIDWDGEARHLFGDR